jgi:hypothetical protein
MSLLTPDGQGRRRAKSHRGQGRERPLSSALFAGLQSDREVLLEDQVDPGAHRGAHGRSVGDGGRRGVAKLHAARAQELPRLIRL